jgi:type II secretory pathway component PulJ
MTTVSTQCTHSCRRHGSTLLEVMLVSILMSLLVILVSEVWAAFGRPAADIVARCQVAQEARLAAASLADDLGGCLANGEGRLGDKRSYQFVGRLQPANSQLWLCFDGGSNPNGIADWAPPDTVIVYEVQGNNLLRWDQSSGQSFAVARHVSKLEVQDLGGGQLQIQLTFAYRNITQTYTLIARDP